NKELRGSFNTFQPGDTISWFAERDVELKVEEDGRMFPVTDSSQTIIDCFQNELKKLDIPVIYQTRVHEIIPNEKGFKIDTDHNNYQCDFLVITTGGFNKAEHYQFIEQLGIEIIPPTPSLFTFNLPQHDILS